MLVNQSAETTGKYQVAKVFIDQKHLVLVIDYFPGYSTEIFKGKFMGVNRGKGSDFLFYRQIYKFDFILF